MARAKLRSCTPHLVAWAFIALIVWAQAPGQIAADTKFDLTTNPAGFLAQALHAYTDRFTLGQLQNQAYGYLFPQGAFFLLPLPAWVLQRCWWTLLVGLAFSGTYALARRLGMRGVAGPAVAGALYAFSPRILTTLTAISLSLLHTLMGIKDKGTQPRPTTANRITPSKPCLPFSPRGIPTRSHPLLSWPGP
ncbi:alpha-(1-_3)-arabinofuranosyltransferase family protein [Corynebacterium sp. MC3]|uniref:alpha-(1->3)-arabinofuranosyltransferase domain-containing protein n=1 Tax=Corynebacterium sp. MC3 TaxID=1720193 RepID=UPI0008DA0A9F